MVGMVAMRRSICRPEAAKRARPSWGSRRSAMLRCASTLIRETIALAKRAGGVCTSRSIPSMPVADLELVTEGFDVDIGGALVDRLGDDFVDQPHDRCLAS